MPTFLTHQITSILPSDDVDIYTERRVSKTHTGLRRAQLSQTTIKFIRIIFLRMHFFMTVTLPISNVNSYEYDVMHFKRLYGIVFTTLMKPVCE